MELKSTQPGYWEFVHLSAASYIHFRCPCGCKYSDAVRVWIEKSKTPKPPDPFWAWNGSETTPTLSPSLRRYTPCHFHGHLNSGVWSAEKDSPPVAENAYRGAA